METLIKESGYISPEEGIRDYVTVQSHMTMTPLIEKFMYCISLYYVAIYINMNIVLRKHFLDVSLICKVRPKKCFLLVVIK